MSSVNVRRVCVVGCSSFYALLIRFELLFICLRLSVSFSFMGLCISVFVCLFVCVSLSSLYPCQFKCVSQSVYAWSSLIYSRSFRGLWFTNLLHFSVFNRVDVLKWIINFVFLVSGRLQERHLELMVFLSDVHMIKVNKELISIPIPL